jgi:hypothetical protein
MYKFAMTVIAGAGLLVLPALSGEARAELEVKRSTVEGFRVGAKVSESTQLAVPKNGEVEFFQLPAGPSYTVKGPYTGTLTNYTDPCPWWKAAVGSCHQKGPDTGATRGVEVPGATRGFKRPEPQPQ